MKITIIAATNRPNSRSEMVAAFYQNLLLEYGHNAEIINLAHLPNDMLAHMHYVASQKHPIIEYFQAIIDQSACFVFIIPEYNGSFPGVLKLFVDALRYPDSFKNKHGALVGIGSGTQGANLAMSHFADVLNYMGMFVLPQRPRLAQIHKHIQNKLIIEPLYIQLLKEQIEAMLTLVKPFQSQSLRNLGV